MNKKQTQNQNNQSGFVLIGILIVIVIIALAVTFTLKSAKKTENQAVDEIEQLDTSLQGAQKSVDSVREKMNDISAQERQKLEEAQREMMK